MIKVKKWFGLVFTMLFSLSLTFASIANTWAGGNTEGSNGILLGSGELSSQDIYQRYGRGEIFSTGISEIRNGQDGKIYVNIETYAHKGVDKIQHAIALEQWNEKTQDWEQVGYWSYKRTKEDEGGNSLLVFSTDLTLTGYQVNRYYRVCGIHLVELNGEVETGATETNGVLITKN